MAKKKAAKLRPLPEKRLEPLKAEAERLGDEKDYAFHDLCQLPFYRAIVYYMMFTHLLEEMREKLGGIDDDTALAHTFFWYSVVFEYCQGSLAGLNPLAEEPTMDSIEGAPSLYFTDKDYIALIKASQEYVAAHPLSRAEKIAARKILSRCR
jgi:hypothetical protein